MEVSASVLAAVGSGSATRSAGACTGAVARRRRGATASGAWKSTPKLGTTVASSGSATGSACSGFSPGASSSTSRASSSMTASPVWASGASSSTSTGTGTSSDPGSAAAGVDFAALVALRARLAGALASPSAFWLTVRLVAAFVDADSVVSAAASVATAALVVAALVVAALVARLRGAFLTGASESGAVGSASAIATATASGAASGAAAFLVARRRLGFSAGAAASSAPGTSTARTASAVASEVGWSFSEAIKAPFVTHVATPTPGSAWNTTGSASTAWCDRIVRGAPRTEVD